MIYAAFAGLFTWMMTALGSATVLFFKTIHIKVLSLMLGFASGVMIAASFWSLLAPAIDLGGTIPAVFGFMCGGIFLFAADHILPHLHSGPNAKPEGINTSFRRSALLVLAITLHNIPEGLAVGIAFGTASNNPEALPSAIALAIGIGIQNFPEGAAVSIPLRREGLSRSKSFFLGQASGIVEPISAVIGVALSSSAILPFALAFAAGAMIFVVSEELIPEAQNDGGHFATLGVMIGFVVMMALDTFFA